MTEPAPRTYADHVVDYAQAGWPCILPVPVTDKFPPPVGFTGAEGRDTTAMDLVGWAGSHPEHSIALRMPDGVIGIDVDQYVKGDVQKRGAETLTACLERWGPLPATWTSTAREADGPSRIYFFRVPSRRYATKLTGNGTGDVEIIQRHHRYAVVWPSPHSSVGSVYRWYDPRGVASDVPPKPDEFPELPAAWVEGLTEGATMAGPAAADRASGESLLDQLRDDWRPECADITSARLTAAEELARADAGSRHDTMTGRVHQLVQLAAGGHTGVAHALLELRTIWEQLTAGEDRADELERMLLTSARKAVTVVGAHQVPHDPCLLSQGQMISGPAPGDDRGAGPDDPDAVDGASEGIQPARWWSMREVIGAHAFDPNADLDQSLAEAVLERTWPGLRYAYDANQWLLRVPERWETRKKLSEWAVAQVATLMPVGDPGADKESEAFARAKRRARLNTHGGAKAVASKMDALVVGGMHPCALRLADLDNDPETLWAGGLPWSLRASIDGPTSAVLDPATPHLHSAGILPERRDTPLWDAFLAAVWPDPALRAWAVRVLSISLTGYADRALPILLGETGRGKTQVVHLLMSVLGSYAHAADPRLMTPGGESAHASIVYALKGRRLSFIDEGPREGKVAQERLKQLTGGGELTANQMRQDPITFRPSHTLVLTTNDEPPLTDAAIRSRARIIPCDGDPELVRQTRAAIGHLSGRAWRAEAPGVLAQFITEAAGWLADPTSAHVTAAPEQIRYLAEHLGAEQDPIRVWVEEETEPSQVGTPSRELYQAFTSSCMRNNLRRDAIPSETKWGRALTSLGYGSMHTEQGKRRPMRVRSGGFMPGMAPDPAPRATVRPDGLDRNPDGLLTGSQPYPSGTFSQVNPSVSIPADGSDGFVGVSSNAYAHTPAGTTKPELPVNPSGPESETAPDLRKHADANPSGPATKPRAKRERTPEAVAKASDTREAKRQAAIAAAAGGQVPLPAVVLRDGSVRSCTAGEADVLLATITDQAGALTVDVETSGYPVGHRDFALRTVQLGDEAFAVVLDPDEPEHADVVRRHLAAADMLHAHSATADLVPLAAAGLVEADDAWARMHDTGILAKLADPASTGNDSDLKNLSKAMLGEHALSKTADEARAALFKAGKWLTDTEVTTPLERSGWAQVDSSCETMVRYAASDVLDDAAIARRLPQPAPAVLERERTAQRMTARVAHHGIRIDGDQVERLLDEHTTARAQHAERVQAFGVDNPGSTAQVAEALGKLGANLPRTNTGRPSAAAGVLEPMRGTEGPVGDLVGAVLDYRHHNTAIGLFLEPYRELVQRGDGRARPTVYTLGADTGRMSCVRPNLQQVSREGGLRACFTADPGHLLVSADFASVELRVAAALSGDAALAQMLAEGVDVHMKIAQLVWGPDATKANRYKAKPMVFGRIYGSGVQGLARSNGVSEAVARSVIDAMDVLTPGLTEWSRLVRDGVEAGRTQFQAYSGRVIHLPKRAPHAGPNYCIQGTARELLVDALIRWADTRWGEAVLFPVHDELVVMVPEEEAAEATAALEAVMTSELHGVRIAAEASTPTYSWSDSV